MKFLFSYALKNSPKMFEFKQKLVCYPKDYIRKRYIPPNWRQILLILTDKETQYINVWFFEKQYPSQKPKPHNIH